MGHDQLDSLSAIEARLVRQEGPTHRGALALFEGPPPGYVELLGHIRSRLRFAPRYRQKLATAPLGLGGWRWIDDPTFNLAYHVRHTGLPAPGDLERLRTLTARVFSQRLDRTKPLWELWLVEGLRDGGWALLAKTHRALVDGPGGVDLLPVLLGPEQAGGAADAWHPRPEPSPAQLAAAAIDDAVRRAAEAPLRVAAGVVRPRRAAARALRAVRDAGAAVLGALESPPESPLDVPLGPHRRYATATASREDVAAICAAFDVTALDVVLASVAGALRAWLHGRGVRTEGLKLRASVPLRVPGGDDGGLAERSCPLPVHLASPVDRLRLVAQPTRGLDPSTPHTGTADAATPRIAPAADAIAARRTAASTGTAGEENGQADTPRKPATAAGDGDGTRHEPAADRADARHRLTAAPASANGTHAATPSPAVAADVLNALRSRTPGPRGSRPVLVEQAVAPAAPADLLTRRLERLYAVPALSDGPLAIAVTSYEETLTFGLLGDYDALPDLDAIAAGLSDALAELAGLARTGPLGRRRPRTTPAQARARARRRTPRAQR